MAQTNTFTCVITDITLNDKFSAVVLVSKREVVRRSREKTEIELADIFITPISGQHFYYMSNASWKKTPASFNVPTKEKTGSHNHFILNSFTGEGLYIVRDDMRQEEYRRRCSIWDLGQAFAAGVMNSLKAFS